MFLTQSAAALLTAFVLFAGRVSAIATDPVSACGPPNNEDHHAGSSCKFYAGPSTNSQVLSGSCVDRDGVLTCVPQ